jgi:hypothetical protein
MSIVYYYSLAFIDCFYSKLRLPFGILSRRKKAVSTEGRSKACSVKPAAQTE